MDTIKAIAELITQINNVRRLVTIGGKQFKWDAKNKKYKSVKDGKIYTRPQLIEYVKTQKYKAPNTPKVRKPSEELKTTKITTDSKGRRIVDPEGTKLKIKKQDIKGDIKNKAKSVTSNIKKTTGQTVNKGNQVLQNLKLRVGQPNADSTTTRALKINKYLRGLKPQTLAGGLVKGGANLGIGMGVDWLADQAVDRTSRAIAGKNKMSLEDYRIARDRGDFKGTLRNKLGINPTYDRPQPTVTRNNRGRVTGTKQPVGRNWQNPEMGPPQPKISYEPQKEVPGPNTGTDSTKQNEKVDKVKVKKVEKPKTYWNAPPLNIDKSKKKKKKKKDDPLKIHGKNPSSIQKKLLKAGITKKQIEDLVTNYNEKYRNKRGW